MSATALQLDPITFDNYWAFSQKHFMTAGMSVEKEAVQLAYETFFGVTLYVQRVMHDFWAEKLLGHEGDLDLMTDVIERYIQECSPRLREQMSYITESQKELLYAVSHDGQVKSITSSAFVKRHSLKSPSAVQAAAKKLLEFDLLTKHNGIYCIADPLLAIWLDRQIK